jgi:hypothetical protein
LAQIRCLPDGRWFDETARTWRDRRGRPARWPDLIEAVTVRQTRVVLAAAHLDNDPANNRLANLRGLCQRCHMLHDRPFHLAQRWLTYRRRWALGDLFFGRYGIQPPSPTLFTQTSRKGMSPDSAAAIPGILRTSRRIAAFASVNDLFGRAYSQAALCKPLDNRQGRGSIE